MEKRVTADTAIAPSFQDAEGTRRQQQINERIFRTQVSGQDITSCTCSEPCETSDLLAEEPANCTCKQDNISTRKDSVVDTLASSSMNAESPSMETSENENQDTKEDIVFSQKSPCSISISFNETCDLPTEDEPLARQTDVGNKSEKLKCTRNVRLSLASECSLDGHCRICHCDGEEERLISPCSCSGSMQHVHESCLVQWMQTKMVQSCELCQTKIEFMRKIKSLWAWKRPTQRPSSILWFLLFVVTFHLNVISVVKDASNHCISTPCIVFYIVGCIGAILATGFSIYFGKRVKAFFRHWIDVNEEWIILDRNLKNRSRKSNNEDKLLTQICSVFTTKKLTTIV